MTYRYDARTEPTVGLAARILVGMSIFLLGVAAGLFGAMVAINHMLIGL